MSPAMAWARLPLQIVLIWLAWWVSRPDSAQGQGSTQTPTS